MTVRELLKSYEINKRSAGLSEDTIERVLLNTNMYMRDMEIRRVSQLSTESIIQWGENKLRNGTARSTMYTYYNSLRSFLKHAESVGASVSIKYERVHCKPVYKQRKALRPAEIKRIIRYADAQAETLIRLMYISGMRISEAVGLTAKDLTDTTIFIQGKGDKVRPIFITEEILEELQSLAEFNEGDCFVDNDGNKLSRKKAYYYVKKAMIKAGFGDYSPHSLRHSFATELLRKGANLLQVSKMMGHSSVEVTQIYTHLVTEDIERTHRLLTRV